MRRYWINFNLKVDDEPIASGQMGIQRERAVCGEEDIQEIARAIAQSIAQMRGLQPHQNVGVGIISWQKFEDEAIILGPERLAQHLPPNGAAPRR